MFRKLRAQSHKTAPTPLQMPIISSKSPGYPQLPSNLVIDTNQRFLQPPFLGLFISYNNSQNQGNTYIYQFIKGYKGYR